MSRSVISGLSVVYVEDDPRLGKRVAAVLRIKGFEARVFSSPSHAMPAVGPAVHIVVADHDLGGPVTGSMFLAQVALQQPTALRVLFTGSYRAAERARAMRIAHLVVEKPCSSGALADELMRAWREKDLQ